MRFRAITWPDCSTIVAVDSSAASSRPRTVRPSRIETSTQVSFSARHELGGIAGGGGDGGDTSWVADVFRWDLVGFAATGAATSERLSRAAAACRTPQVYRRGSAQAIGCCRGAVVACAHTRAVVASPAPSDPREPARTLKPERKKSTSDAALDNAIRGAGVSPRSFARSASSTERRACCLPSPRLPRPIQGPLAPRRRPRRHGRRQVSRTPVPSRRWSPAGACASRFTLARSAWSDPGRHARPTTHRAPTAPSPCRRPRCRRSRPAARGATHGPAPYPRPRAPVLGRPAHR